MICICRTHHINSPSTRCECECHPWHLHIRQETEHNNVCFNRRMDAYLDGPDDGVVEQCKRCDSFYEFMRSPLKEIA